MVDDIFQQEAEDEHHETGRGDNNHSPEPPVSSIVATKHIRQRLPQKQGEERSAIGKEHTERREHRLLFRIVGHHTQHGTVRHVDTRIDGHHHDIGHVGPYQFCTIQDAPQKH